MEGLLAYASDESEDESVATASSHVEPRGEEERGGAAEDTNALPPGDQQGGGDPHNTRVHSASTRLEERFPAVPGDVGGDERFLGALRSLIDQHIDITSKIQDSKEFGNPRSFTKVVQYFNIKDNRTHFKRSQYDPDGFQDTEYYRSLERLAKPRESAYNPIKAHLRRGATGVGGGGGGQQLRAPGARAGLPPPPGAPLPPQVPLAMHQQQRAHHQHSGAVGAALDIALGRGGGAHPHAHPHLQPRHSLTRTHTGHGASAMQAVASIAAGLTAKTQAKSQGSGSAVTAMGALDAAMAGVKRPMGGGGPSGSQPEARTTASALDAAMGVTAETSEGGYGQTAKRLKDK